ncbi:hypothetical protein [Rothia nasimurium]|uniref:hypothetical protein n=1 Tax=Rothia nasimurium TaxID=85336 RepID=UPI002DD62795|nr:hypothetical protein [Rothia nasimurium]
MSLTFRRAASCAAASLLLFTGAYDPAQAESATSTPNDVVDLPTMTQGALNVLDNNSEGFFLYPHRAPW